MEPLLRTTPPLDRQNIRQYQRVSKRENKRPAWPAHGSRVNASGFKAMHGAWSALLAALLAAVAATVPPLEEPEAQDALADLKAKILAGLGMERPPDLRNVNISVEHMQKMTRRYFRNLKLSEQELLTYRHTGQIKILFCLRNNLIRKIN